MQVTPYLCCLIALCAITQIQSNFVDVPVTEICLGCLCTAASYCDSEDHCINEACGAYRITLDYWIASGNLTINNYSPTSYNAYRRCVRDFFLFFVYSSRIYKVVQKGL